MVRRHRKDLFQPRVEQDAVAEGGTQFDEHGHRQPRRLLLRRDGAEQRIEGRRVLEGPSVRRVRARHVERHVVRLPDQLPKARPKVLQGRLPHDVGVVGLGQVDAQRARPVRPAVLQPVRDGLRPVVVEAQTVDQGLVLRQSEGARRRVARRRLGTHGPDLHKPEPDRLPERHRPGILVGPRGQPHGIGKGVAPEALLEPLVLKLIPRGHEWQDRALCHPRPPQACRVRPLGIQPKQQRPEKTVHTGSVSSGRG